MSNSESVASFQSRFLHILRSRFEVPEEKLSLQASLQEDLGLDSIDLFDLVSIIEDEMHRSFDAAEFKDCQTVEELLLRFERLMNVMTESAL